MKEIIKYKLKLILEGKRGIHSPRNPWDYPAPKHSNMNDLERVEDHITNIEMMYGTDSYMQNVAEGDGIYMASIFPNGYVKISTPNTTRKLTDDDMGMIFQGRSGIKHTFVRAYRGKAHPEYDEDTREGVIRGKSPADDAAMKTYLIFGDDIIDFVKRNMKGYEPDEPEVDLEKRMTPAMLAKKERKDLERGKLDKIKPQITATNADAEEIMRKQREAQERRDKAMLRRNKK